MSAAQQDRGMRAVERARSVRERDSRVGLQKALAQRNIHRTRIEEMQRLLVAQPVGGTTDTSAFRVSRASLLLLGDAISEEQKQLGAAQEVADAAHGHWSADKVRLSAVENLLERRAVVRRAERDRRERTELDDVASQLWIRAQRPDQEVTPR